MMYVTVFKILWGFFGGKGRWTKKIKQFRVFYVLKKQYDIVLPRTNQKSVMVCTTTYYQYYFVYYHS